MAPRRQNPFTRLVGAGDTQANRQALVKAVEEFSRTSSGQQTLSTLGVINRGGGINFGFLGSAPAPSGGGGGSYSTPGGIPQGTGVNTGAPGTGGPVQLSGNQDDFVTQTLVARNRALEQQRALLTGQGQNLRNALFQASPEIAQVSQFLQGRVQEGIPSALAENYQQRIREAQAARGFSGGAGPAGQEAQFLTALAEQNRFQAAGQLGNLGQQILANTGLQSPVQTDLNAVGGLNLEARRLFEQVLAGQQQSQLAERLFNQFVQGFGTNVGGSVQPFSGTGAGYPSTYGRPPGGIGVIGGIGSTNFPTLFT